MIVVTVDKQTGSVVGRPEIITRGFVHLNEQDPIMEEARRAGHRVDRTRRATTSARSPCSRPRSRTACRATCTSRRSAGRWSSRSSSRSDVATRRRPTARKPASTRRRGRGERARSTAHARSRRTSSARSSGSSLLVLGAMTLIAADAARARATLTSWWTDVFAPWFGTMRWVVPFCLLLAGWWLEWGPGTRPGSGWGITLLGLAITYAGLARGGPGPGRSRAAGCGRCPRRAP